MRYFSVIIIGLATLFTMWTVLNGWQNNISNIQIAIRCLSFTVCLVCFIINLIHSIED